MELVDGDAVLMGGDEHLNDHLGECHGVRLHGNADLAKPAFRTASRDTVEKPVSERAQGVITECASSGGGVPPPTHPACGVQPLHTLLYAAFFREGISEGGTEFEEL